MYRRGSYVTLNVNGNERIGRIMSGCINEDTVKVDIKYYYDKNYVTEQRFLSDIRPYNGGNNVFIPLSDIDENDH
jgi:hypothetical protein